LLDGGFLVGEQSWHDCSHGSATVARESEHRMIRGAKQLKFDRYLLDLDRGCLLLDDSEIFLRPKTFALLRCLIENAGRLVSKDELISVVWKDSSVTDDALVQSVGELRRALGDAGTRLIRTVPRRGYRFEASVSEGTTAQVSTVESERSTSSISVSGENIGFQTSAPVPKIARLLASLLAGWFGARIGGRIIVFAASAFMIVLIAAGVVRWRLLGLEQQSGWHASSVHPTDTKSSSGKPTIAVLPFANLGDAPTREYFADGLTQDIINALGRFSALTVMSWNAVRPYKGQPQRPGETAVSLGVRYQVEGTLRRSGERVRVTAELFGMDGRVLWSGQFDEDLADVFVLQDKITTQLAAALAIRIKQFEQRQVFAKPTASLQAYDYVLRARPALQRPSRANNVEARALLRHAIQIDPNYAAAYAALAETYHIAVSWGWAESPTAYLARAGEAARNALQIDDREVRAHIILGRIHLFHNRYEQAQAEMERAIAANPSDAHGLAGRGNILMWLGRIDAAIETLELAQRIDPELNAVDRFSLSMAYYLKRRYDDAIVLAERNLRISHSANFSQVVLAAAHAQLGQFKDAARVVATIRRMNPTFDPLVFGTKFRNPADLQHLREGLSKAGFDLHGAVRSPSVK
jgi:TolB-like protein/DNA-binding winged helix-turn-helix (wHTH) protein/cytochrome c-type biogenesis protein CcmH/NrfG